MTTTQRFTADKATYNDDLTDKEKDEEEKAQRDKLRIAMGCLASYFIIGNIAFAIPGFSFEEYSFTDCMYFLMVTLTTVGYGDLAPTTQGGRLFHSFFVLFGISIVAVALVEVANFLIEKREAMLKKTQADVIKSAADNAKNGTAAARPSGGGASTSFNHAAANDLGWRSKAALLMENHPVVPVVGNLLVFSVVFGQVFCWIEGWDLIDGVYFTIITGTTVGYGDVAPQTPGGRWVCFLFLPFAVVFVSTQLSQLAAILLGKSEDSKLKALLAVDLSLEALLNMDTDGDGEITEFEFIKFMMTTAGMADEDTLDSLHKRFKEMDADGSGALTKDDILLILQEKEDAEARAANDQRVAELRLQG